MEHLLYKGTKNRNQKQLETDLAKLGARMDSYTDREHTAYFIQSPSAEVNKVFEILADAVRNSPYNKEAVEVERKLLLKKLDEVRILQERIFRNFLFQCSFLQKIRLYHSGKSRCEIFLNCC